nr:MAG TPA: hypothetical protein [Caudoviricetes sp.]
MSSISAWEVSSHEQLRFVKRSCDNLIHLFTDHMEDSPK